MIRIAQSRNANLRTFSIVESADGFVLSPWMSAPSMPNSASGSVWQNPFANSSWIGLPPPTTPVKAIENSCGRQWSKP